MAGTFTIQSNPPFLNARSGVYTAWSLRASDDVFAGPGVAGYEDFRVKQRGAGANLSADIGNTAYMRAAIRGTTRDGMGLYLCENCDYTAPTTNTFVGTAGQINTGTIFTTGDATNPRIDQVFLRVLDQQHDGGGSNLLQVQVVDGTPTGGATLDNRTGVGATPANSILLADVLMPALATTVATANIRDRRQMPLFGAGPWYGAATTLNVDIVTPQPSPALYSGQQGMIVAESNAQSAAAFFIPRRIVGATKIRWRYAQQATALTGNYNIAIYDASGRIKLANDGVTQVTTGVVAITGAGNSFQTRSETIPATTLEPGWYYVAMGAAALATGAINFAGVTLQTTAGSVNAVSAQGTGFFLASGGTTMPTTLTGFADLAAGASGAVQSFGVPLFALSVG